VYGYMFQILTSVPQEHTTAVLTPYAVTPRDHICAVFYPNILEMGVFSKVKCSVELTSEIRVVFQEQAITEYLHS